MDKQAKEKMESLMKYIPFLDFILNIDNEKYVKFIDIRLWIISKKKYCLDALNKIEKSITTQYKNLVVQNDVKIPEEITNIFAPMKFKHFVNLCSDDEEDVAPHNVEKTNKSKTSMETKQEPTKVNESDDDLEIISIDFVEKTKTTEEIDNKKDATKNRKQKKHKSTTKSTNKENIEKDEVPLDIFLSKVDEITKDDLKQKNEIHEPNNYTYQQKDFENDSRDNGEQQKELNLNEEEPIFDRRNTSKVQTGSLFKRRKDFKEKYQKVEEQCTQDKADEVEVRCLDNNNSKDSKHFSQRPIEIISLDSESDTEDEDNQPCTSKQAALRAAKKSTKKETTVLDKINEKELNNKITSDNQIPDLSGSMDSLFADIDDVLDEAQNNNSDFVVSKSPNQTNKVRTEIESNKENVLPAATEELSNNDNTLINLSQEDITKIYMDVDIDTLSSALEIIKQKSNGNSSPISCLSQTEPAETPPPVPPPINMTPPCLQNIPSQTQTNGIYPFNSSNVRYPTHPQSIQHMPQHLTASQYPHNNSNFANMPPSIPAPIPKHNDPRIRKQLDQIKNAPALKILNPGISASIMQYCQSQQYQQAPQHPSIKPPGYASNKPTSTSSSKTTTTYTSANISYGEHKRRQEEKRLEEERLREERKTELVRQQRLLDEEKERKTRAEIQKQKLQEEMRTKLLSTLKPCEDLLTTMWKKNKSNSNNIPTENNENTSNEQTTNEISKEPTNDNAKDTPKEASVSQNKKSKPKPKSKSKNSDNNNQNKENNQNKKERRLNRIYKELKCTFKGFDQLNDYYTNDQESNTNKETTNLTPKSIGLKRRSSIHALTAISEQLKQTEYSDPELSQKSSYSLNSNETSEPKRRLTDISYETISSQETRSSSPKRRRKTIDDVIKPTKRAKKLRILDDDDDDSQTEISSSVNVNSSENEETLKNSQESLNVKKPIIKIKRLSENTIRKHANKPQQNDDFSNKLKKKCEKPAEVDSFTNHKQIKKSKRNNDCQMTERNTSFCVLCNSKPSDLTNHYIGRHKTESYVSRLDWSELDDLTLNTPIAKLLPKTKNRYEVECPFCKEPIQNTFMNLYHHYSSHTGEYAFQCGNCNLSKPYQADIQSHILHSKTCRNTNIKVLYRYSTNAQCIYLHYCAICNFVQINEANVLKHLREHHERSQNIPSNVNKCILVAISDGPEVNETIKPPTPSPTPSPSPVEQVTTNETLTNVQHNIVADATLKFKVDDDDIPVGNEPCLEDDEYSVEDQLKQLHEEPAVSIKCVTERNISTIQMPMTVIPCMDNEPDDQIKQLPEQPSTTTAPHIGITQMPMTMIPIGNAPVRLSAPKHIPIKNEFMDIEEKCLVTPERSTTITANDNNQYLANTQNLFITYQTYRNYPSNVNFLGLYKCMIDDCYYSTDSAEEFYNHLIEHYASEEYLQLSQPLQCPYCIIPTDITMDPGQLIEHVRTHHSHMIYQCSLCCYRSCDASNVNIHQQIQHISVIKSCKIYKCSEVLQQNSTLTFKMSLDELLEKNVKQICCKFCKSNFYHTQFLINHFINVHKIHHIVNQEIYSCLYCPLTLSTKDKLRYHLATYHPNEKPLIYDHNLLGNNEDIKNPLSIIELTETVDCIEPTPTNNNISVNQLEEQNQNTVDIKPSLEQLMEMNEETLRVRLSKLTQYTGIPPDNLYRCPETKCGGFFSNYNLWLRHMKNRHQCIECQCPHCNFIDSLQQLELHFEQHRRHTFICFHCPATFASDLKVREHAANNHSDLGEMRLEFIRFNISYSYGIILKLDLYQERQIFIAELLKLSDERLKELKGNESKTLKQQWPVHDNALWINDYLAHLQNRKVLRNCIMTNCGFHTANPESLYEHMRSTHVIEKTTFNCSTCDFQHKDCSNLEDIINHVKIHNSSLCICTACVTHTTTNRFKMSLHIEQQHTARDVPVVRIFKNNHQLLIEIYVVFADNCLTFSTIKNCFCCPEKNMNPDRFTSHLRRYHKFILIYYCEKCKSNLQFQTLDEVKKHFQQEHSTEKLKIRCKLSAQHDLRLISLNDFQVEILMDHQQQQQHQSLTSLVEIKNEPLDGTEEDDDVILLDENDIVIENALREAKLQQPKEIPKIKCAPLGALIQPKAAPCIVNTSNISINYQQPSILSNLLQNSVPQQSTSNRIPVQLYGSKNNATNISSSNNQSSNLNAAPSTTPVYLPYRNNNNSNIINPPPTTTAVYLPNRNNNSNIINPHPTISNEHIANPYTTTYNQHVINNRNVVNSYLSITAAVNNSHNTNLTNSQILITPPNFNSVPSLQSQHSINHSTYNALMSRNNSATTVNNSR